MNKLLKHRVVAQTLNSQEWKEISNPPVTLKRFLVVAGYSDFLRHQLILFRLGGVPVIVPFDMFKPSGTSNPDFSKLEIIDHGYTIKLGEYEADTCSVLEDLGY